MSNKQPEALRLADLLQGDAMLSQTGMDHVADELLRLHALNAQMLEALQGLDEAYCRAGAPLTRDERAEDRRRLMATRAAIAAATEVQR